MRYASPSRTARLSIASAASIVMLGCHSNPYSSYSGAVGEAKKLGIAVSPETLQLPLPPADKNAAPFYNQISDVTVARPVGGDDGILNASYARAVPTEEQLDHLARSLRNRSDIVGLVHRATSKQECVFKHDWSNPIAVEFKEFAAMRSGMRVLNAESMLMAHRGKPLQAIKNEALGFRIGEHTAGSPILIGYLVDLALDAITFAGMQHILLVSGTQTGVADAVKASIEKDWKPRSLSAAMRSECGMNIAAIESLRKQSPGALNELTKEAGMQPVAIPSDKWPDFLDENGRTIISRDLRLAAAADMPYTSALPSYQAVETELATDKDPNHYLAALLTVQGRQIAEKQAQGQAMAACTYAGACVLSYKKKHGSFPKSLADAIKTVPIDPFTGQPLEYRTEESGFVVYSVGKDHGFSGEAPRNIQGNYDILFRYPVPDYYKREVKE